MSEPEIVSTLYTRITDLHQESVRYLSGVSEVHFNVSSICQALAQRYHVSVSAIHALIRNVMLGRLMRRLIVTRLISDLLRFLQPFRDEIGAEMVDLSIVWRLSPPVEVARVIGRLTEEPSLSRLRYEEKSPLLTTSAILSPPLPESVSVVTDFRSRIAKMVAKTAPQLAIGGELTDLGARDRPAGRKTLSPEVENVAAFIEAMDTSRQVYEEPITARWAPFTQVYEQVQRQTRAVIKVWDAVTKIPLAPHIIQQFSPSTIVKTDLLLHTIPPEISEIYETKIFRPLAPILKASGLSERFILSDVLEAGTLHQLLAVRIAQIYGANLSQLISTTPLIPAVFSTPDGLTTELTSPFAAPEIAKSYKASLLSSTATEKAKRRELSGFIDLVYTSSKALRAVQPRRSELSAGYDTELRPEELAQVVQDKMDEVKERGYDITSRIVDTVVSLQRREAALIERVPHRPWRQPLSEIFRLTGDSVRMVTSIVLKGMVPQLGVGRDSLVQRMKTFNRLSSLSQALNGRPGEAIQTLREASLTTDRLLRQPEFESAFQPVGDRVEWAKKPDLLPFAAVVTEHGDDLAKTKQLSTPQLGLESRELPLRVQQMALIMHSYLEMAQEIRQAANASHPVPIELGAPLAYGLDMSEALKAINMLVNMLTIPLARYTLERVPLETTRISPTVKLHEVVPLLSSRPSQEAKPQTPSAMGRLRSSRSRRSLEVKVESLKDTMDLRELRRKITRILREEARRHGVL